jgi:hypothetical protein
MFSNPYLWNVLILVLAVLRKQKQFGLFSSNQYFVITSPRRQKKKLGRETTDLVISQSSASRIQM